MGELGGGERVKYGGRDDQRERGSWEGEKRGGMEGERVKKIFRSYEVKRDTRKERERGGIQ